MTEPYVLAPLDTLGDTTTWGLPARLELVGDYLVVADFYATYQVVVLDAQTGREFGAFGRKGSGPREIQEPDLLFIESTVPPRLWIYDTGNDRFSLWALDEVGPLTAPIESFRVKSEGGFREAFLTTSGIVSTRKYGDALLYLADSSGRVRKTVGELPYPSTDYLYDAEVNYPLPSADPARQRLVLSYLRTNRLDFYDVAGRHIATGAVPVEVPPLRVAVVDGLRRYERPLPMTFGRASATARRVYVPYCHRCTTADRGAEYRLVQVFDWTGVFLGTLDLGTSIWAVEASDDDSVLYAAVVDPYPLVLRFLIPEALRSRKGR